MGERRFVIAEIHDCHSKLPEITESELSLRLASCSRAFSVDEDVEPEISIDQAFDILLHGEGEQGEAPQKTICPLCYFWHVVGTPCPTEPNPPAPQLTREALEERDEAQLFPLNQPKRGAPQPTREEWEKWVKSVAIGILVKHIPDFMEELFLSMPCVVKE